MNAAVADADLKPMTEAEEEAALQALLDKKDAELFGDKVPAKEPEDEEPAPDPMKLTPEPEAEPAKEPAKEPDTKAAEPAEKPASTETSEPKEPAKEPAKSADSGKDTVQSPETSDDDAALIAAVPEGPAREALKNRLAREAEKRAKLEQDNRSMAGRVSAYQRRYEEATGKRQPAAEPVVTPEQKAEWKTFASEFPEIAKAIEAKFAETLPPDTAAKTTELIQYIEKQKRDQFLQDAWAAVDAVHPNWRNDGRTEEFRKWKESSSTYEKLAASDDIADAIALFDLYESHKGRTKAPAPTPVPAPADTAAADQVAARREKQAEGAATPSGKPASPNQSVDLNDEDQLFAFYAKNADARMKRRHL